MEQPKNPRVRNAVILLLAILIFMSLGFTIADLAFKEHLNQQDKAAARSLIGPTLTNEEKLLQELGIARSGAWLWIGWFQCDTKESGIRPEAKASYDSAKSFFVEADSRLRLLKKTSGDGWIRETTLAYHAANFSMRRAYREQYCELDSYVEGVGWTPRADTPADEAADYCRPVESSLLP